MDILLVKNLFFGAIFLDFILAIFSFYFSFTLLRRRNDKIAFNFGMATLCLGFWLITLAFLFLGVLPSYGTFLTNLTFIFGIGILHFFYIFTLYFPVIQVENHKRIEYTVSLVTSFVALSTLIPGLYCISTMYDRPLVYINNNPVGLSIYTFYFALLSVLIAVNLRKSFLESDGHYRAVIKKIGVSSMIAIIVNLILSIIVFYIWEFDTSIIGAIATSIVIYYIYSILHTK